MVKTVHFTWKDNAPPADIFPSWWRESWLEPGWESRLWTDRDIGDFIETLPQKLRTLLQTYPRAIMRADAFRYLVLKQFGGLYVDLDFVNLSEMTWLTESLLSRADEKNPVSATGPRFLTAHASGKSFHQIPREWVYPVAWDDAGEIDRAKVLGLEGLKQRYPNARAIHIWSSSWFAQCDPPAGRDGA